MRVQPIQDEGKGHTHARSISRFSTLPGSDILIICPEGRVDWSYSITSNEWRMCRHDTYCQGAVAGCQMAGEGAPVCPMSDQDLMSSSHTSASREDIKGRLCKDCQHRIDTTSPTRDIFQKTTALISALQLLGCRGPMHESRYYAATGERRRRSTRSHTT